MQKAPVWAKGWRSQIHSQNVSDPAPKWVERFGRRVYCKIVRLGVLVLRRAHQRKVGTRTVCFGSSAGSSMPGSFIMPDLNVRLVPVVLCAQGKAKGGGGGIASVPFHGCTRFLTEFPHCEHCPICSCLFSDGAGASGGNFKFQISRELVTFGGSKRVCETWVSFFRKTSHDHGKSVDT